MRKPVNLFGIQKYLCERLRAEIAASPRGHSSFVARRTGLSTAAIAHLSASPPTMAPGIDTLARFAKYWGITLGQLESLAAGKSPKGARNEREGRVAAAIRLFAEESEVDSEFLESWLEEFTPREGATARESLAACEGDYTRWLRARRAPETAHPESESTKRRQR